MSVAILPRSFARIREVAQLQCSNITLGQLMRQTRPDPSSLMHTARWLHRQLPVRFARRIEDFLQLPHVVVSNRHISEVLDCYLETFEKVSDFPEIKSEEDEALFHQLMMSQLDRHANGTLLIAEGYREVRRLYPEIRLDDFLNGLFTVRIAVRVLMENYVEMRMPKDGHIGVVRQGMRPISIVSNLSQSLKTLTRSVYGISPELEFRGNHHCELDYIPRHVGYMVRELLKNALRATVERYQSRHLGGNGKANIPPVVVELQQGDVHVIIKISDQGGGMPKRVQREAWQYGWSTVPATEEETQTILEGSSPKDLAGYGFGLPLTRLHAQYFGGDVFMQALPGHGTDMYLLLTHLKEGTPSTELDDLATVLSVREEENAGRSLWAP